MAETFPSECDILVVGGGNAGFCAALSAIQHGSSSLMVVLIDKCPRDWAGGNTYFTAGAFRTVHAGLPDLLPLVNNVDDATAKIIDLDPYTPEQFSNDLSRMTAGRSSKPLAKILISDSNATIKWLAAQGIRFQLSFNRQSYKVNGRYKFWGGMALKTENGGKGLVEDYQRAAANAGIQVFHDTAAKKLLTDSTSGAVTGVLVQRGDSNTTTQIIRAKAVILAGGGFEANARMRSQYLGPGWDLAYVRGTPYNTGDCLEMAMRDVDAKQVGHWSGCHSVAWDANASPESGNRSISNEYTKSGYPLGVMINNQGDRFVDEGVDLRNFTYAKFGRAILAQPDGIAFQVWDATTTPWLRSEEYRDEIVNKIWANSIEELADKCLEHGLQSKDRFINTLMEFNEAVHAHRAENPDVVWDPAVKDGLSTQSRVKRLQIPKTNWALPIENSPFMAVKVSCGVTFTFGGLAVNPETTAVLSNDRDTPGLFCVGEMLGGLFYGNYPGGSGLTSGAVFGRRAGKWAALRASEIHSTMTKNWMKL